jgi:hypothetical protein
MKKKRRLPLSVEMEKIWTQNLEALKSTQNLEA